MSHRIADLKKFANTTRAKPSVLVQARTVFSRLQALLASPLGPRNLRNARVDKIPKTVQHVLPVSALRFEEVRGKDVGRLSGGQNLNENLSRGPLWLFAKTTARFPTKHGRYCPSFVT